MILFMEIFNQNKENEPHHTSVLLTTSILYGREQNCLWVSTDTSQLSGAPRVFTIGNVIAGLSSAYDKNNVVI